MTHYVILKKSNTGAWIEQEKLQQAASSTAAIKQALNGADEGGEFIAVPARSWQVVKVSIEKAVRLG